VSLSLFEYDIRGFDSVSSSGGITAVASKADTVMMRMVSRRGVVQLVLVSAIAWVMLGLVALAFHRRPCISPAAFLLGQPRGCP
jgi:hypothetical protein